MNMIIIFYKRILSYVYIFKKKIQNKLILHVWMFYFLVGTGYEYGQWFASYQRYWKHIVHVDWLFTWTGLVFLYFVGRIFQYCFETVGLEPILSNTEKSHITPYYWQYSAHIKIQKNISPGIRSLRSNKTVFNLIIFSF